MSSGILYSDRIVRKKFKLNRDVNGVRHLPGKMEQGQGVQPDAFCPKSGLSLDSLTCAHFLQDAGHEFAGPDETDDAA